MHITIRNVGWISILYVSPVPVLHILGPVPPPVTLGSTPLFVIVKLHKRFLN